LPHCRESLDNLPQTSALHYNNCHYISHHLLTLGHQFSSKLCGGVKDLNLTFVHQIPNLRQAGEEYFNCLSLLFYVKCELTSRENVFRIGMLRWPDETPERPSSWNPVSCVGILWELSSWQVPHYWEASQAGWLLYVWSRPHQIWANVSDLYVSWSKVAIGLIVHKNDKNNWINCCLTPLWALPWKQPKNAKSQQPKELEQFLNEPERTCSYLHLIHSHISCVFLRYLRFLDYLMNSDLSVWILMLTGTCMKLKYKITCWTL